ncbi:MAG: transcriptional repressor [Mycobacterium sp.]|nr:transcriptional repressor [Mycobacterium sp.]
MTATPRTSRDTPNRRAVLNQLGNDARFRSARELHLALRQSENPHLALSTVYRILHALAEDDLAETQRTEDGEILYRLRQNTEHRHYLLCRKCGDAVGFVVDGVEQLAAELGRWHDFTDLAHSVDIYGICAQCSSDH